MTDAERPAGAVLAEAADAAGYAPSVHNTQPWRWRVTADALDLYAVRDRQLRAADAEGRLLTVSCGAALHHAVVAVAAQGRSAVVTPLPDPADPDHLARIGLAGHTGVTPEAMRRFQAVRLRHTDRRPVSDTPASPEAIAAIGQAVAAEGIQLHILTPDQVLELAAAASHADQVEAEDEEQRAELAYWRGGDRPAGTGIPDEVVPGQAPQTTVPGRDFVRAGTLTVGPGHDRAASYAILYGPGDEPADWLRAGAALSAGWLTATELGVTVLPFSSVIELPSTRQALRSVISNLGYPYLVVRLGTADPETAGPPHTPRLPAAQTIEVAG
ncbi:Acg family FMN-binding oxidoreductase [Plantactinospora sp. KLBMP9567]|uniref:Acg family FMN-binding oxidoreductase n=1 Tax=Plantactinospora sp. KLBMP9567 TaxID=3085900 RepID=UPI002981C730|nr:nitroreductase [Plantactinospora sp. KLBMP9567]MDW5330431.1 nitroreductase [Plantactinospora sp. KLBMP9567]